MKVAIYTIALNEEQFVKRWYESAKDADYLLIADTGSTDNTIELAKSLGINVVSISINPWRFDHARNAALDLLPEDIDMCISLDMDEVITPNWREPLEKAFKSGITRPRYKHVWSWKEDGSPGLEFGYDHIHTRKGYRWKTPVHEALYPEQGFIEKEIFITGLETHHHPDATKSRSQYLPLLEMSVKEDPDNDRSAYYYARELFFYNQYEKAADEFKRYLSLPSAIWNAERSSAYRYLAKCDPSNESVWYQKAFEEDPNRKEAILDYAMNRYKNEDWINCYSLSSFAIQITEKPLDFLCEEFAWGSLEYDLASISAYNLGLLDEAIFFIEKALEIEPNNLRFASNLFHYTFNKNK